MIKNIVSQSCGGDGHLQTEEEICTWACGELYMSFINNLQNYCSAHLLQNTSGFPWPCLFFETGKDVSTFRGAASCMWLHPLSSGSRDPSWDTAKDRLLNWCLLCKRQRGFICEMLKCETTRLALFYYNGLHPNSFWDFYVLFFILAPILFIYRQNFLEAN